MKKDEVNAPGLINIGWYKKRWAYSFGLAAILLLGGCGGGSSSGGDSDNDGNLAVTVLDDPLTGNPLAGAYVSLYNSDNQTILKTIKTGSDGVASFANVSSSVTITVAQEDNGQGRSEIRTIYDFKPGDYSIFMKDVGCAAQETINATYSGIADASLLALLDPHLSGDGALLTSNSSLVSAGSAGFTGVSVCLDDIQSDGKLSHFVYALDSEGEITSYGFETDQTITAGATYTGIASLTPTNLNWSAAAAGDNPDIIVLQAVRKGVSYSNLGFWPRPGDNGGAASGAFPAADQFPADAFVVIGTQNENVDNTKATIRRYDAYQQNVSIDFSENEFSDFSYDVTAESFDWTLTGNSGKDFVQVSATFGSTIWSLNMSPDAASVKLPDLHADVQDWFNRTNINIGQTQVFVGDLLATSGYSEYNALSAATAGSTTNVNVDSDMVFRTLDVVNGGGGNGGGGSALYGTVTLVGDEVNFPVTSYQPDAVTTVSTVTVWGGGSVVLSMQSLAPFDATKAVTISLARNDGITSTWVGSTLGISGIVGVSVTPNSVVFTDVVVTNQVLETSVTINGTLSY